VFSTYLYSFRLGKRPTCVIESWGRWGTSKFGPWILRYVLHAGARKDHDCLIFSNYDHMTMLRYSPILIQANVFKWVIFRLVMFSFGGSTSNGLKPLLSKMKYDPYSCRLVLNGSYPMFNQTLVLVWAQESGQIAARQPRKIGSQWSGARCRDLVPWCRVAWWTENLWGSNPRKIPYFWGNKTCWNQWPWLRNRLIGGTYHIFLAYFWGLCKGISPQNMAKHMVLTYLHQLDPEIPIDERSNEN